MDPLSLFSPQELAAYRAQARIDELLYLTGLLLRVGFLVAFVASGLHLGLRRWCERIAARLYRRPSLDRPPAERGLGGRLLATLERLSDPHGSRPGRWLVDGLYPVGLVLIWIGLMLPFSFFASYVLPHERGLATLGPGLWWLDRAKGLGLQGVFSGLLGLGLFGLARRLPRSWWLLLWGAVVAGLLGWSALSPYRARIFHDFSPLPAGPARQAVEQVMGRAGLRTERIEVVDTSRRSRLAGAYVMGQGPSRRVVLSDNLVRRFHPREIAVALGHELGHERQDHQRRTWLSLAASALVFLGLLRLLLWGAPRIRRLGLEPDADPAVLPLVMLVLAALFLANQPLSAWLDRREEVRADREALALSGDPTAFCSLMVRLARTNQAEVDPPALTQWFFGHHPTVRQRLEMALRWAKDRGQRLGPGAIPLPAPGPEPAAGSG